MKIFKKYSKENIKVESTRNQNEYHIKLSGIFNLQVEMDSHEKVGIG